ncbi:MAG: FdtA/QdtA family cupin domain-containing protein [Anaerolineales bacterium]|nr:FdtA/QdtA family cupin domain-containing protein [Anaerolineales bacterium]
MTLVQQQVTAAVAVQFKKASRRRYISGEAGQDFQNLQRSHLTHHPVNLSFNRSSRHSPVEIEPAHQMIQLPKITDLRGCLSFIEEERHIPFKIRSASWLYDTTDEAMLGSYVCQEQHGFIIAISGSIEVILNNSTGKKQCSLNQPDIGLYVPNTVSWQIESCSTGAVILILAS